MDHYFSILDTGIAAASIIIPLKTPQTRTHAQIWTSTFLTLSEKCQLKLTVVSASFYVFRIWLHYIPCCTSLSVYPGIHLLNRFIHGWISSKAGIQTQNRFWIQTHKHTHTHCKCNGSTWSPQLCVQPLISLTLRAKGQTQTAAGTLYMH